MSFFDITRSISLAEEEFLNALSSGLTPPQAYKDHWQVQILEDPSLEAPQDVLTSRLNIILNCFSRTEEASKSAIAELGDLFDSLELDAPSSPSSDLAVSPSEWLLRHLHNPYPSPAVKVSFELSPELQGRSVNEWFVKARQRIGWTRLLRDRFAGCRTAATDAAFRALVRDDPCYPLDPELNAAFLAVRSHAKLVFSITPPSPASACHTPTSSRSLSPVPSLTHSADSSDSEGEVAQPLCKRKRCCPSSPSNSVPPRHRKRRRTSSQQLILPIAARSPPKNDCSPPPRFRKRRLSESNPDDRVTKRSRGLDWAARKQTVPDPLPLPPASFNWELWCNENFTLPPSVTTQQSLPDPLDFELFNFEAFPIPQITDFTPLPGTIIGSSQQSDSWVDSLLANPGQFELDSYSASREEFFSFELPCQSSPPSSSADSPSDPIWSLSPPEFQLTDACLNSIGSPLFDLSSPPLFRISTLYPTDGVQVVDTDTPLIS